MTFDDLFEAARKAGHEDKRTCKDINAAILKAKKTKKRSK